MIAAFAVDKLGAGNDNLFDRQLLLDDQFVEQGCADAVDVKKMRKIREQILIGRQMNDGIHTAQRLGPVVPIPHVAHDAFGPRRHPIRPSAVAGVHGG